MPRISQAAELSQPTLPATWTRSLPVRVLLIVAATLIVAAAAHVSVPLWFTPVPLTLQPLAVLAVGLALGPLDGAIAMLAYLAEGAAGLPVFSPAVGLGGIAQIVGPTGGFLMSYPFVAGITGSARRLSARIPKFPAGLVVCTAASVVLFAAGATWFMHLTHLSSSLTWAKAVAPFMPGAVINICVAAGAYAAVADPLIDRIQNSEIVIRQPSTTARTRSKGSNEQSSKQYPHHRDRA